MEESLVALITSLKLAEKALDKCTDEQKKLQPQINRDHCYILDKEYKFIYACSLGAEYFGLQPSDMEGRRWRDIGTEREFIKKLEEQIDEVLTTRKTFKYETFQLPTVKGERYFQYTLSPLCLGEEKLEMVLSNVKDITEWKTSEIILTRQIEQLRQAINKIDLIGEMAAGVAHEIRNPMTVMKGYLQFFSKKVSGNMSEQFAIVLSELDRVEQIISNFLSLAKNKVKTAKMQDLNTIIKEISPLIFADAVNQGINLNVTLADDLPDLLLNSAEIKQLILNLARNGIEAMEQHGTLTIETSWDERNVYLCISDCGCGISEEWQGKMFTPFLTTKETGTGLGLSVCSDIVKRHDGAIAVQSTEGKGTTFTVTFPLGQEK